MGKRKSLRRLAVLIGVLAVIAVGLAASIGVVRSDRAGAALPKPAEMKEAFCVPVHYVLSASTEYSQQPWIEIRCGQVAEGGYRYFEMRWSSADKADQSERVFTTITTAQDQQRPLVIQYVVPQRRYCASLHYKECGVIDAVGLYKKA